MICPFTFRWGKQHVSTVQPSWRSRAIVAAAVLAAIALPFLGGTAGAAPGDVVTTLSPAADTYVAAANKNTNYGTATSLKADASPVLQSFVRFDVPALSGPVLSAKLRLYVNTGSTAGFDVRSSSTSWQERTVKYTNAPTPGAIVRSSGAVAGGQWVELDVTPLVRGGGPVGMALTTSGTSEVDIASRENTARAPQLIVTNGPPPDTAAPAVTLKTPAQGSVMNTTPSFGGVAGTASGDADAISIDVYSGTAASGTPVRTLSTTRFDGIWSVAGGAPLAPGTYTARATQRDAAGNTGASQALTFQVTAQDPSVLAAGDIGDCNSPGDEATGELLDRLPGTVVPLGDIAYNSASPAEIANCYGPSWGRQRARTRPIPGDHDYDTPNAAGYFGYFGAAAGDPARGYYSYDLGQWHVVALNTECDHVGGCGTGDPQEQWLRADLAAHPTTCTLAFVGTPRFSSGTIHGSDASMVPIWRALQDYGAEVVLSADEHIYERFAPQTPAGVAAADGIRQFTVGTGGSSHYPIGTPLATSEVRNNDAFGVVQLTLHPQSYEWRFHSEAGKTFSDSGQTDCHTPPPAVTLTQPTAGATTGLTPTFSGAAGTASGDLSGVTVNVYSGSSATGTPVRSIPTTATGSSWTAQVSEPLEAGTYTVQAEQSSANGTLGRSAPVTFTAAPPAPPTYPELVVADGATAYWRFGEASGTIGRNEITGGPSAIYNGAPLLGAAGALSTGTNTAVELDGVNDTIRMSNGAGLNPTNTLSLEAWVRPSATPTSTLVRKEGQYMLRLRNDGALVFRLWSGGSATELVTAAGTVRQGAWNHVVARSTGSAMSVWVDGTVRGSTPFTGAVDATANGLYLGSVGGGYDWYTGRLDEVAIYDRALSAAAIASHYATAAPTG